MTTHRAVLPMTIKDAGDRLVETVLSSNVIDRGKDSIDQNGWKLDAYRLNPVVLWNHDPSLPPIARSQVRLAGGRLVSRDEFPPAHLYPLADQVLALVKAGFLRAKSVGSIRSSRNQTRRAAWISWSKSCSSTAT